MSEFPESLFINDEGCPSIPQISRIYRIPNTGSAKFKLVNAEFEVLENINPLPLQYDEDGFTSVRRNEVVYTENDWYPREVVRMSEPMIWRISVWSS